MGSESSKPVGETHGNWDDGNGFQIISPRSDISNPSDILRVHHHHTAITNATQSDRNRRVSKTITKSMPKPNNMNAPQALYFPTTETEQESDRIARDALGNKENQRPKRGFKKMFGGCFEDSTTTKKVEVEMTKPGNVAAVHKPSTKVNTDKLIEASKQANRNKKCTKNRRISEFDATRESSSNRQTMAKVDSHERPSRRSNSSRDENRPSKDGTNIQKLVSSAEHKFVIRETEGMFMSSNDIADVAMHHEDDYFARLTAEPSRYSEVHDSPIVNGREAIMTLPSVLDKDVQVEDPDSPVSNLFAPNDSVPVPSFEGATNEEKHEHESEDLDDHDQSEAPTHMTGASELGGKSVVHSLQKFHTQIRLNATPEMHSDEEEESVKMFLDETNESSCQDPSKENTMEVASSNNSEANVKLCQIHVDGNGGEVAEISENVPEAPSINENDRKDDSSVDLSYFRPNEMTTDEAFKPKDVVPEEPLKQVATLGRNVGNEDKSRKNKLEALFRPILPSLSVDDASAAAASYDPYEIKVAESAPSALESRDYRTLALRPNYGSPESFNASNSRQLAAFSPSMVSIDSQVDESPARTRVMVSNQALCNAEFLFSSDYKFTQKRLPSDRDSGMFSISTLGARSRMSQRSQIKPVKIPVKNAINSISDDESRSSSINERRVRFSETASVSASTVSSDQGHGIDTGIIERKMSDLTDKTRDSESEEENLSVPELKMQESIDLLPEDEDRAIEPASRVQWEYSTKDGITTVTPHRKGNSSKNVTNSPYLRFQAAKSTYETPAAVHNDITQVTQDTIVIPAIESKVSDLTESLSDFGGRLSNGSMNTKSVTVEETIPEEEPELEPEAEETKNDLSSSPPKPVNWSYSEKDGVIFGVTPQVKGRSLKNATNSPFLRFKDAKKKFGAKGKESLPIKSRKSSKDNSRIFSPRKQSGGGVVSSRIQALNQRVKETRKMRRLARSTSRNPRLHAPVETNIIRTQAIMTYKTDIVDIEKRNIMGAAKFNRIIYDDDDDDLSEFSSRSEEIVENPNSKSPNLFGIQEEDCLEHESENIEDYHEKYGGKDDGSELMHHSDDDNSRLGRLSEDTESVATVRQSKGVSSSSSTGGNSNSSHSFSNVRRQVFRGYDSIGTHARQSVASSTGESTTLSSLLRQDHPGPTFRSDAYAVEPTQQAIVADPGNLHLSPTQRTPMEARKWRSLAAAAKEKDAMKRANKMGGIRSRKGLYERNSNTFPGALDQETARFTHI